MASTARRRPRTGRRSVRRRLTGGTARPRLRAIGATRRLHRRRRERRALRSYAARFAGSPISSQAALIAAIRFAASGLAARSG